jgi:CheY-like chemotaxis protein
MKNSNPIIIIDDDDDDLELITASFNEMDVQNEVIGFNDAFKFIEFIKTTDKKCFFILCDINMNALNGIELKRIIHNDERLRLKGIPFVLMSTGKASHTVTEAYTLNVQGYFIKPNSVDELKKRLQAIIDYWSYSEHPNS